MTMPQRRTPQTRKHARELGYRVRDRFSSWARPCIHRNSEGIEASTRLRSWQTAETLRQRRSRIVQILNVPQRVRFRSPLSAALLGELFEQPAGYRFHAQDK